MSSDVSGVKPQHDVLARDTCSCQLLGDRPGCAIVLNPYLAANDVEMHNGAMHAAASVPPYMHQLIVVFIPIQDCLGLNLSMRRLVTRVFLDQATNNLTVTIYSIHWITFDSCSSKISILNLSRA